MKIYKTSKESEISNTIVEELNAKVLTKTFDKKGIQKADLYSSKNTAKQILKHGNCPPVNSDFLETILIDII